MQSRLPGAVHSRSILTSSDTFTHMPAADKTSQHLVELSACITVERGKIFRNSISVSYLLLSFVYRGLSCHLPRMNLIRRQY